jgi:hypothetical protein
MPSTRKPRSKRSGPKAASPAGANGALTLAQAQRQVLAAQPRRARQALAPRPSPDDVGRAREALLEDQRDEREAREREYTAVMRLMKQHGARRAPTAGTAATRRRAARAAESFVPLQIFAEGDSWFDYPVPFFRGGVIPRLQKRLGVPILNLAKAGDETRFMLGVEQRRILEQKLRVGCPAGGPWDVLLFSGGGNDIVDDPMALWVLQWDAARPAVDHLHPTRFALALSLVQAAYEDLILLRDRLSPDTHLVFHAYDFAIPDGRGICHHGPWLKPTFDLRGFPAGAARVALVREMLRRFAVMLSALTAHPRVSVVPTQGVLAPVASAWHNELHPGKKGFDTIADLFRTHLEALFPDRVA